MVSTSELEARKVVKYYADFVSALGFYLFSPEEIKALSVFFPDLNLEPKAQAYLRLVWATRWHDNEKLDCKCVSLLTQL